MASQQTLIIFAYLKIRFCITSNNYFWYWNTGFFLFLFFYFEQKENIISPSIIGQQKEKKIIPSQTYTTRRNEKAVMCIWRAHACSALTSEPRLFFSPLTHCLLIFLCHFEDHPLTSYCPFHHIRTNLVKSSECSFQSWISNKFLQRQQTLCWHFKLLYYSCVAVYGKVPSRGEVVFSSRDYSQLFSRVNCLYFLKFGSTQHERCSTVFRVYSSWHDATVGALTIWHADRCIYQHH